MTDVQLGMRFIDKVQAISAVRKWSISVEREYRVLKSKINTWTTRYYIAVTIITVHKHTCLVQIEQNKHRNLPSKFISMSISHIIANDLEIPMSNIIQEVQVFCGKWKTYTLPCSYFLQCVEKMGQEQILMCRRYIRDKRTEELTKCIFIRS
ncbi:hypothetical protein M9H77_09736 [Catharanthus roseus]|uniref:Uncharacterized protein n=1 Tax=Catharanthus roseus TaxID=4058 RepID=A0ACC0C1M3_CATRO|nr:hypothetical protein M9H77_09736 [Catharanthus roseus]